jgi:hypothetical protein
VKTTCIHEADICPRDPYHRNVIVSIVRAREDALGRGLTSDDLRVLIEDMRTGRIDNPLEPWPQRAWFEYARSLQQAVVCHHVLETTCISEDHIYPHDLRKKDSVIYALKEREIALGRNLTPSDLADFMMDVRRGRIDALSGPRWMVDDYINTLTAAIAGSKHNAGPALRAS